MSIDSAIVPVELLQNVVDNITYNKVIIEYYTRMQKECILAFKSDTLKKIVGRIDYCNKFWQIDKYEVQKVKDFKKTNLCHDKFCANCKKVKQAGRMAKYVPVLEQYQDKLYHLTLTLPNCPGEDLLYTYRKMASAFKKLIIFIDGRKKISGIDFGSWGYEGAVRSLEVTFNGDSYHPHFHVALVMSKGLGKKKIENDFSFDNRSGIKKLKRLFSSEEILIQKIWYLILNDIKVTKKSIDELEQGYSCSMDKFAPDKYTELFKYMTKASDEEGNVLTYENFVSLYYGLYRVKQIQGYGCLYQINDELDLESLERQYDKFIQEIAKKESPMMVYERPQDLISDSEYKLISRKTYFKYLRQLDNNTLNDKNK